MWVYPSDFCNQLESVLRSLMRKLKSLLMNPRMRRLGARRRKAQQQFRSLLTIRMRRRMGARRRKGAKKKNKKMTMRSSTLRIFEIFVHNYLGVSYFPISFTRAREHA